MMKNYFKPGSNSFKVIELLNAGKSYDEIAKAMKYKNKNTISGIVSEWKLKDRLEKKKLKTEETVRKKRFKAYERVVRCNGINTVSCESFIDFIFIHSVRRR